MAGILHRLGYYCFRHKWLVVASWVVVAGGIVLLGLCLGGTRITDKFDVPGTESDRAQQVLQDGFGKPAPTSPGEAPARLVVDAGNGTLGIPQIDGLLATVRTTRGVAQVTPAEAAVTPDGKVTFVDISFTDPAPQSARDAVEYTRDQLRDNGYRVLLTSGPFYTEPSFVGGTEAVGVLIAALVLILAFGSFLAAGVPILVALVGVGIGTGGVFAVSTQFTATSATLALSLMLGLAVGIDYTLFLLSRHRRQLADGLGVRESAALATATAGSAIVFAGVTVVIALLGLSVAGIPFLTGMGVSAAAAVAVVVALAVTLGPALLGFAGPRLIPAGRGMRATAAARVGRSRWGALVTGHPLIALVAGVGLLAVVAVPALGLRLGVPNAGQDPASDVSRQSYDLLAHAYGPGLVGPLIAVVHGSPDRIDQQSTAAVTAFSGMKGVDTVLPAQIDNQRDTAQFVIVPSTGPTDTRTEDLVRSIRAEGVRLHADTDADLLLTGETVLAIDISAKLRAALIPFLVIVVGLALLVLTIAFRSLLVPLTAAVGFLLSVAAALGATTAVYQWGWLAGVFNVHRPAPVLAFLPIILIGVLFGLAMDYQVFLVSGMREEFGSDPTDPRRAVRHGYASAIRVVAAAAIIMIAVFGGFMFSHNTIVGPIGFALGVGVLFDAVVVRMTLIPAVMSLMGRYAWWLPSWLDKILPHVDAEGREQIPVPVERV